jgi:hypothetical protein
VTPVVAPVVLAASVSGAISYVVARTTANSVLAGARIGANVEREKLEHTREAWLATRRDKAARDLIELTEQMEIVANRLVLHAARLDAAGKARNALTAIVITLNDDSNDALGVSGLAEALRRAELERASTLWSDLAPALMSGRLR